MILFQLPNREPNNNVSSANESAADAVGDWIRNDHSFHLWRTKPKRMMDDYESDRLHSELGSVFRIANSLHDQIDAVVFIADPIANLFAKGIQAALCQPYHNEASRSQRGSKPRAYYLHAPVDPDDVGNLCHRLGQATVDPLIHWQTSAESRFALSVCLDGMPTEIQSHANEIAGRLSGRSEDHHADTAHCISWIEIVASDSSPSEDHETIIRLTESSNRFRSVDETLHIASPILFPMAMLGLDCVQYLAGVHQMQNRMDHPESEREQNEPRDKRKGKRPNTDIDVSDATSARDAMIEVVGEEDPGQGIVWDVSCSDKSLHGLLEAVSWRHPNPEPLVPSVRCRVPGFFLNNEERRASRENHRRVIRISIEVATPRLFPSREASNALNHLLNTESSDVRIVLPTVEPRSVGELIHWMIATERFSRMRTLANP